ncbi:hypothetical protein FD755_017698 [Muntiacus reevesi]|uniref:Uncharacterized protein n=1 Tax=Muntiacus reevesi TaxID=9886 RepID=A0A5N3XDN5_MUNRE|nr:hypothetical protein FD755_017698 [Muntiacus reevesi]
MAQFVCDLTEKAPGTAGSSTPAEVPTAIQSLKNIINSAKTTLLNHLEATEVWMWFYIGEIIGNYGIIGYDV